MQLFSLVVVSCAHGHSNADACSKQLSNNFVAASDDRSRVVVGPLQTSTTTIETLCNSPHSFALPLELNFGAKCQVESSFRSI